MKLNFLNIVEQNSKRLELFTMPYNPLTGLGSPLCRKLLSIPEIDLHLYLPTEMMEKSVMINEIFKHKSFTHYLADNPDKYNPERALEDFLEIFAIERFIYDFEFWATSCVFIKDRTTGDDIPFIPRKAQRKLLKKLEKMRVAGVPIYLILLKARQWGGSTLVQIYMMWIQQIHKTNWNLVVCAQDDSAAANISEMYTNAAEMYPPQVSKITLRPYARSPKNRICAERGGIIGVGSINNPKQFRSYRYFMIHLSEVGVWEDTLKRSPEELAASLMSSIPDVPYSLIAIESTAKGIGNYFHQMWQSAIKGESDFVPVFVAWWEIEDYQTQIIDYHSFIKGMNEYDWFLWQLGATLEGINWYNKFKRGKKYTDHKMQEEFPSTAEEAFISSGRKVYHPKYIQAVEQDVCAPEFVGEIFADSRLGENALKNIKFNKNPLGSLSMWTWPDKKQLVKNRYCFFADIGGRSEGADYSVLRGIDRYWMMHGGDPEFMLTWRGHLDQDLFAWKCAQICMAFAVPEINEYPLLAFEVNSLKKEATEGDHFYTVLNKIAPFYTNLYIRNDHEKIGDKYIPKYGFHTNHKTKGMIIDAKNAAMRERYLQDTEEQESWGMVERDQRAVDESKWFETKKNGTMGAVEGQHDDIEIASAGSIWLATDHMELPCIVEPKIQLQNTRRKRTASDF